jgi:hypothetical protein
MRTVGFDVPSSGDLPLTHTFQKVLAVLSSPCGGPVDLVPLSDSAASTLAAGARVRHAGVTPGSPAAPGRSLAPWLLAIALLLTLMELFVRRSMEQARSEARGRGATATQGPRDRP